MANATAVWKMVFAPRGSYVGITYGFSRSFTNEETGKKNERPSNIAVTNDFTLQMNE